jgi:hemerythrin
MEQLVWKPGFAIGINEIDRQHKLLLIYLNEGLAQDTDTAFILKKLKTYALVHFSGEEKLMGKINYPGFEGHQRQHRLFDEQMEQLEKALSNNESQTVPALVSFMRDWFLEHILVADAHYANYMRATMNADEIRFLVEFDL